jgi:hypothetical protein
MQNIHTVLVGDCMFGGQIRFVPTADPITLFGLHQPLNPHKLVFLHGALTHGFNPKVCPFTTVLDAFPTTDCKVAPFYPRFTPQRSYRY